MAKDIKMYLNNLYLNITLLTSILSLYESDETVRTSVSVLGKSIRGRKSTSSSVSDPGSDASVPGTCSGRGRQKGTA